MGYSQGIDYQRACPEKRIAMVGRHASPYTGCHEGVRSRSDQLFSEEADGVWGQV